MTNRAVLERRRQFAEEQKRAFLEVLKQPPKDRDCDDASVSETFSPPADEGLPMEDQP
jgi:hypothetical protein